MLVAAAAAAALGAARAPAGGAAASLTVPCTGQTLQQPFLAWLDPASYVLAPNGGLESGPTGWTLTGGAAVVAGNEPFRVRGAADARSLALPAGATARSGPMCVGLLHPTLRFFTRDTGPASSRLAVDVVFTDRLGTSRTVRVAAVAPSGRWAVTLPYLYLANATALPLLTDGTLSVAFRFTAVGGSWWIDDVYVDPYKGR